MTPRELIDCIKAATLEERQEMAQEWFRPLTAYCPNLTLIEPTPAPLTEMTTLGKRCKDAAR